MAGRRKGAVRVGQGTMCNICGVNCGRGGAVKKHVELGHSVDYDDYKLCFYKQKVRILADAWDDGGRTKGGKTVLIHTLVRRMTGDPGPRGATRSARVKR